ncbi:hypothetical protein [Bdellovibrio bacteriovorus]|uniref:hypothetical protein n=1 Tax=Bdellovibrio bacteriovorus TaxID=959 RepID=UPI00045BECF3|nr:hypothetical protein [Bdellovibrio bacteriovorus]AHZ84778.1 hypothetical protein EP01_07475 [Bdellovibrio bacteriovorus]BEV68665.1 hypothetical protein Bb109J_c2085 [Bdellovibrio bacteriovorus]
MRTYLMIALLAAAAVSCSYKEKKTVETLPSAEAKTVAVQEEASHVTEFGFSKGSSTLSSDAKGDLQRLIDEAKKTGTIKEIKVITWGDKDYPSTETKKLSSAEVKLVKERNKAIENYIKSYDRSPDVDLYSMAERPNLLEDMLNTSDSRIKKNLETAGIPTTDKMAKVPSKASKSIVMVIME